MANLKSALIMLGILAALTILHGITVHITSNPFYSLAAAICHLVDLGKWTEKVVGESCHSFFPFLISIVTPIFFCDLRVASSSEMFLVRYQELKKNHARGIEVCMYIYVCNVL